MALLPSTMPEELEQFFLNNSEYQQYRSGLVGTEWIDRFTAAMGYAPPVRGDKAPPPSNGGEMNGDNDKTAWVTAIVPILAAAGVTVPAWLLAAVGLAVGAGAVAKQVETHYVNVPGPGWLALGGPGLKEPPAYMVVKEWRAGEAQFYKLIDGRVAVYSRKKGTWKVFRPQKHIVLSRNPKVNDLIRADRKIDVLMKALARRAGLVKPKHRK